MRKGVGSSRRALELHSRALSRTYRVTTPCRALIFAPPTERNVLHIGLTACPLRYIRPDRNARSGSSRSQTTGSILIEPRMVRHSLGSGSFQRGMFVYVRTKLALTRASRSTQTQGNHKNSTIIPDSLPATCYYPLCSAGVSYSATVDLLGRVVHALLRLSLVMTDVACRAASASEAPSL